LREISERRVARAHNAAPERRVDAGKQPQERRLSRPIRADESDPLAILQNATQPCKDFAGAIMAIEIGKTDEFHGPVTFTLSVWCFLRDRPQCERTSWGRKARDRRCRGQSMFDVNDGLRRRALARRSPMAGCIPGDVKLLSPD